MINYTDTDAYNISIEWDENDPVESVFNGWTQIEFTNALRKYAWHELCDHNPDVDRNKWDPSAINKWLKRDEFDYNLALSNIAHELHNNRSTV